MLTVCIPAYNYNVKSLVNDLLFQMRIIEEKSQIIIIDDGSQETFKNLYKELQNEKISIILLDENIGRSRIRNCFLNYAQNDNLLFLDSDSEIIDADFLKNYFRCIERGYAVICGGRIYPSKVRNRKYVLHWKYGNFRESKTAVTRNLQANRSFMTNNFMIRKEIFQKTHFSDKLYGYGHEDTLLGFELQRANVKIEHIDNPVLHGKLETNKEFLVKTVAGIQNLIFILNELNQDEEFINSVSLLKFFFRVKKRKFEKILSFMSLFLVPFISMLLRSGIVNLRLFDLYKLLVFSRFYTKQKSNSNVVLL